MTTGTSGGLFTFYNPKYALSNFLSVDTVNGQPYLDIFNPRLKKLLDAVQTFRYVQNSAALPLTTLSYIYYGTTTLDWLILMYNGYFHELEIPNGAVLKVPDLSNIKEITALQNTEDARRGQIFLLD